jgi:hypothetical protein
MLEVYITQFQGHAGTVNAWSLLKYTKPSSLKTTHSLPPPSHSPSQSNDAAAALTLRTVNPAGTPALPASQGL